MISVIIPSKNSDYTLEACLKAVFKAPPYDKEIIIVDGHSTDKTPAILEKYSSRLKVVYDECKGIGLTRNIGVEQATRDIIAFLDSDVICAKDHFTTIIDYFSKHSDVGAVDIMGSHPEIGTKIQRLESLYRKTVESSFRSQETLRGWSMAFRKSVFDEVGGFWSAGAEDSEISNRLKAKGYKIASLKASSWHIPRPTLRQLYSEMVTWGDAAAYYHYKAGNNAVLYKDFYARNKFLRMLPSIKAIIVVTYVSAPLTGLRYLAKTRNFDLYCYFILVHAAYLRGYLRGVQNALDRYRRELAKSRSCAEDTIQENHL